MLLLLAGLLFQDGRVEAGQERHSAVRLQLSGRLDVHYVHRGGGINQAGGLLGSVPLVVDSTDAWSGRASLRADIAVKDSAGGVVELENRSFDEGLNRPFSSDPELDEIDLKQAYVFVDEFLSPAVAVRIGVQGLAFRNRPHDEPFFLDLGESEGFFDGFDPATSSMRNTVDRDVREAAGVRVLWSPYDVLGVQTLAATYGEGGSPSDDEQVYLVAGSARIGDAWAAWLLLSLVNGGPSDQGDLGTLGAGIDGYFGAERSFEVFAEAYLQRGNLVEAGSDVDKKAWAANLGARVRFEPVWIEAAASHRSGNRRLTDSVDEAFQSYENENRFLILQSSEFGLDVDTNVTVLRGALGAGPFDAGGHPLRLQVDVGRFEAPERVRLAGGAALDADDWGVETDVALHWSWNESLRFWVQAAFLAGSDLLEALTLDAEDRAALAVAGAELKF
jgi:hypothetical protein